MRRLAACLIALAAFALPLRAQTIPVALGGQRTSLVGLPFGVPVTVDMSARPDKLGAFALRITWNPAVLQFKSGADGSFGSVTVNQDSAVNGILRVTGANPAGVGGLVTIGTATFVPLTADTATFALQLTELYAAGSFADLLPSAQVAAAAVYCPARGRYGDINGDGGVGSADALIALTSVVGLPTGTYDLTLGDVDASGTTTARDALIMLSSAVGLDVSAYRVFQVAGGSCAAFANTALAVVPGSFSMLVGQQAPLELRRTDSTGALVTLTDIVWRSSKPGVVGVLADGTALARDTGTATITAVHGTTDSAAAIIRVDSNRTLQIVDAQAGTARVQLGTAAYPFGTIAQAMVIARAGDTVEVKPGSYHEPVTLDRDVRLLGDTAADGSRPMLVNPAGDGVLLTGPGSREVHNFGFGAVADAVNVNGPASVTLTGLVGLNLPTGIVVSAGSPVVRLSASRLAGSGSALCCSSYGFEAVNGPIDSLIITGSEISDFYSSAVYAPYGGTFVIRTSRLHDFGNYALELGVNSGPGVRLVVDSSYLARASYELLDVADLVSGTIAHSTLVGNLYQTLIYQWQENVPTSGFLALHADSLVSANATWLYANNLDSVLIDSVSATIPASSGNLYTVGRVRVARSVFRDVSSDGIYLSGGGVLDVRATSFTGDPAQDLSGYPVYASNARTTIDSVTFQNAYRAVQVSGDSSLTVTNSSFQHISYPVTFYGNWASGCIGLGCVPGSVGATVRHNSFTGYYTAVDIEYGALAVDSNVFSSSLQTGIYGFHNTVASVTFNTMAGDAAPISVTAADTAATSRITDNTITGVSSTAIYAVGTSVPDSIHTRFEVLRNQVACAPTVNADGIVVYTADLLAASNQVTNCGTGITVSSGTATSRADSVVGNVIQTQIGGAGYGYGGVTAFYNLRSRIIGNTITMDTAGLASYGPIYVETSTYTLGTAAIVDSNAVNGGLSYGLSVYNADTVLISRNTVTGSKNTSSAALLLSGTVTTSGRIYGNTVRRPAGTGIVVSNGVTTDTILVDSNMVSHAGQQGVLMASGAARITRNTLDSNLIGIEVSAFADSLNPFISQNNLFGNTSFGLQADVFNVIAANNWWGDTLGPSCSPNFGCAGGSLGDAVSTSTPVSWFPPLTAPVGSAPPPSAPRVFASAPRLVSRAALRALPAPDAMPAAPSSSSFAPAAARVNTTIRPVPAGAPPALARLLAQDAQRRAAALARITARQEQEAAQQAALALRRQADAQLRAARPARPAPPAHAPGARP